MYAFPHKYKSKSHSESLYNGQTWPVSENDGCDSHCCVMNEWNGLIIEKGYNVFFKMWYHDYQRHTLGEPYCVTWAPKGQQFVLYINQQIAMLNEEWPFLLPYFTCLLLYGVGGSGRLYSSYRPYDRTSK